MSPKKPEEAANGTTDVKDDAPIVKERSAEDVSEKEEGELGDTKSD